MLTGPSFVPEKPAGALVLLHGYGSGGDDLFALRPMLSRLSPDMAFFCPDAPYPAPFSGRQWFDLSYYPAYVPHDEAFLKKFFARMLPDASDAARKVKIFVQQVVAQTGVPFDKVFLGGFSQGGLTALLAGMTMPEKTAGIIGLSACALVETASVFTADQVVSRPPVTLIHGTADPVVPFPAVRLTLDFCEKADIQTMFYPVEGLGHGINDEAFGYLAGTLANISQSVKKERYF